MIAWGLISAATFMVTTPSQFYLLRFLLGAAEAGFFPGIILYLTYWFPAARRGRVTALFVTAVPVASVIGAPLSGYLLESFDGLPSIIKELGYRHALDIGLISAIPFGVGCVAMLVIGHHADLQGERRWHIAVPAMVGGVGLFASALLAATPPLAIAALTLGACGVLAAIPQTWALTTVFIGGGAAASGIALINSVGNLSGFVGPYAIGWLKDTIGSTTAGISLLAIVRRCDAGITPDDQHGPPVSVAVAH